MYYAKRTANGKWIASDGSTMTDRPVGKTFCDAHAMFIESGEEFVAPKRIVIDENDIPYIRIRIGVTDWKRGTNFVPYRYPYASPVSGRWEIHDELPEGTADLTKCPIERFVQPDTEPA